MAPAQLAKASRYQNGFPPSLPKQRPEIPWVTSGYAEKAFSLEEPDKIAVAVYDYEIREYLKDSSLTASPSFCLMMDGPRLIELKGFEQTVL